MSLAILNISFHSLPPSTTHQWATVFSDYLQTCELLLYGTVKTEKSAQMTLKWYLCWLPKVSFATFSLEVHQIYLFTFSLTQISNEWCTYKDVLCYVLCIHVRHHQSEQIPGRMDPCVRVVYTDLWPKLSNVAAETETRDTRKHFSYFLLFSFSEHVWVVALIPAVS